MHVAGAILCYMEELAQAKEPIHFCVLVGTCFYMCIRSGSTRQFRNDVFSLICVAGPCSCLMGQQY